MHLLVNRTRRSNAAMRMACVAMCLLSLSLAAPHMAQARGAPESFADLAEGLLPSVVNISTTQSLDKGGATDAGPGEDMMPQFPPGSPFEDMFRDFFDRHKMAPNGQSQPSMRRVTSLGSGFVIDPSGYIVTNNHVIQNAEEITVILHDDTNLPAKVVGRDSKTDLAVLKVTPPRPLTAIKWGDSDKLRIGDWVLAIGNPFGLGGSVTAGIISARARDINAGPYDDFLQTDAPINRGNSGGPIFSMNGDVIGVATAILSPSGGSVGIGFAIPASMAQAVVAQLKDHGKIRRGWIGVRIQNVNDDIAKSLGLEKSRGALVSKVMPNSPASKAGLQTGDVILSFDGKDINEMRRLPRIVAETPIDRQVSLNFWRKGRQESTKMTIAEMEVTPEDEDEDAPKPAKAEKAETGTVKTLGITVSKLTQELRRRNDINDKTQGVLITAVSEDGPAADKGVRPGSVLIEVNQQPVDTVPEAVSAMNDAVARAHRENRPVLLLIEQRGDLRFVALQPSKGAKGNKEKGKAETDENPGGE